ncbi:hypothetical protein GQ472_05720 [archaeon]|nr:hypothetical protein [archaeon]
MGDICVELCQISGKNKYAELFRYKDIFDIPITNIEYPLNERQAYLDETLSVPLDVTAVSDDEKLLISYSAEFGAVVFRDIAQIVKDGYAKVKETFTDEKRKNKDYYDTLAKKLDEEIGNELEQYKITFEIDDALLKSAIHLALEDRIITPTPSVIFEYGRSYTADEKGMIHISEDDAVAIKIIDLLTNGSEILVHKIYITLFSGLSDGVPA